MAGMRISDIFTPDRIMLRMEATDKFEVFEELADLFAGSMGPGRRDEVLKAVIDRENKMSTGIGNGIAVPHAKLPGALRIRGALGVSSKGIEYDALDGEPVRVVFLFVSGAELADEHLELMKGIAKLALNPGFATAMEAADRPEAAHGIIVKYEALSENS